ncbi:MAG TPA: nuclear transport factor 2 family protein [Pyrinomonadaceae bacterium]|jgi:nuclear transport factor 2 (NTF2) superfamily protein
MISEQRFLQNLYEAFNRREVEKILSVMQPDVVWANGMEGGFVYGRDAVREYWRKQFEMTRGQLEPLEFQRDENGRSVVTVHLMVRDLEGNLLAEKTVRQIFTIENGLISLFEIGDDAEPLKLMKTADE